MKHAVGRVLRHLMSVGVAVSLVATAYAAGDTDTQANASPQQSVSQASHKSQESQEIQALKQEMAEQRKQIEELRLLLLDQKKQIDSVNKPAGDAKPVPVPDAYAPVHKGIGEVASSTPVVPPAPPPSPVVPPPPAPQASNESASPLQIHIGDATITPVGFMDMTNTWRSTNSGASLATNFGNFPYSNTVQGHLTEDRMSAQNSRLGLRVDATFKGAHVLGYYEGDFVGFAPGNSQVTSNSMTYRLRLYWINVRKGFWEVQAGQSWSMLTPNRNGISALPGDLFYGQAFDVNYLNGLTWGRIPGFRFIGHPSKKVTFGISLESPEQYIGGSGGSTQPTLPAAFAGNNFFNQVNNGNTTTSVPNLAPDIIAKVVFEPSSRFHFEIAGLERSFKTYNPANGQYFTKMGGGGSVNFNWAVLKNLRIVSNNFWSDGGGRYLFGEAPDMIIRADGSPSLVHSGSLLQGIEANVKNISFYAYYGGILITGNTALDTNGKLIGWGYNGAPNSQNRIIQEGTFGWTHTLWKDSKYGAVQWMAQYAYFTRSPYSVAAGTPSNASQHAVWFNLRYVLPGSAPTIEY